MGSLADDSSRRPVGDRRTPAATSPRLSHGDQRRTIGHRNCFAALVFMARTSTPWRFLPAQKLGCGSPATAWRRLMSGARAGVFDRLHLEVLDRLALAGRLDWSRASVDSASVGAKRGGPRGRRSRRSWQAGVQAPLRQRAPRPAADRRVTAANAGDTSVFEALCDDVAAVLIPDRRRRSRPGSSTPTRSTTMPPTGLSSPSWGSRPGSAGVGSSRRASQGGSGGGSSGRCRGYRATGAWQSAGIKGRGAAGRKLAGRADAVQDRGD
jgi:transposase